MATRLLASWYYQLQDAYPPKADLSGSTEKHAAVDVQADHAKLIADIGAAGTVLVTERERYAPLQEAEVPLRLRIRCNRSRPSRGEDPARYGGGYRGELWMEHAQRHFGHRRRVRQYLPGLCCLPVPSASGAHLEKIGGILRWDFWSQNPSPAYVNADACLVFINAYASESFG